VLEFLILDEPLQHCTLYIIGYKKVRWSCYVDMTVKEGCVSRVGRNGREGDTGTTVGGNGNGGDIGTTRKCGNTSLFY
jgi:hypothetical protein